MSQEQEQDSQELLDKKEGGNKNTECKSSLAKKKQAVGTQMEESKDDDNVSDCICGGCQDCNVIEYKREKEEARKKEEKDPLDLTASKKAEEEEKDCPSNCGSCPICLKELEVFYLKRAENFKKKIDLKESGKLTCADSEKFCVESNPDFEERSDCPDGKCGGCKPITLAWRKNMKIS
jgi:hypothetical protein